jgi:hypothetical protein
MPPEQIAGRDAREEARRMLGGRGDARVLEPSPPAVSAPPWFADDPTEGRPLDWSPYDWVDAGWRRERWLGPFGRLRELPAAFAATRGALHELAERTISPARAAVNGKIGLRWTLGGFGTPFFGADEQLRVEHGLLVRQAGDRATIEPLGDAVDRAAASALGELYGFATSVLEVLRAAHGEADPSRVQLWPEHFDVSVEIGVEAAGQRAGYGVSPGDERRPQPYLYVVPWGETPSGPRWQARGFSGAELDYAALLVAPNQRALALEFFAGALAELVAR